MASERLTQTRETCAHALVTLGARTPSVIPRGLNGVANFLAAGRLLRQHDIEIPRPLSSRFEVFDVAITIARPAERPLYLEFGVWEGDSIRYWASGLAGAGAHFVGFDSFEGLPEHWTDEAGKGHFSTSGVVPEVDDPRVSFVKGWFSDSLLDFRPPSHDLVIVNVDCDLYSSASEALAWCSTLIKPRDLLYFDEFHDRLHEGRAFEEFLEQTDYRFRLLAATKGLRNVLFQRLA